MIGRIHPRGTRVAGLLAYLFGAGRKEDHVRPRLVAAWSGAGELADLEPATVFRNGRERRNIGPLAALLEDPVRATRRPPRKFVWHCSLRLAPGDRTLSDDEWRHIAEEVMSRSGLAPAGDDGAVRWVAVRHADDHIHIAATLVRQDGRTEWARNDYRRVRAAAMDLERRFGLLSTAPADGTAARRPGARELNKAVRQGRAEAPRERLRKEVRGAAAIATDADDFFALVRDRGILVKLRHSVVNPGEVTGYAVALADHRSKEGSPIWYGGGRLAPDLTLPRLQRRWRGAGDQAGGLDAAVADLRSDAISDRQKIAIGESAADLLTAMGGKFTWAADLFDRAVREPSSKPMPRRAGGGLRALAGVIGHKDPSWAMLLRIIANLAEIADHIAEIRASQQRIHQARAARAAAEQLRAAASEYRVPAYIRTATRRPTYGEPIRPRGRGR